MHSPLPHIKQFGDKASASRAVSEALAEAILQAVEERGIACVLLSGGSTPKEAYRLLFAHSLPWEKVVFIPVDDRWVPDSHTGSNFGMMEALLADNTHNKALLMRLVPDMAFVSKFTKGIEGSLEGLKPDVCLMGMGTDGHTASWFPNSAGIETALSDEHDFTVTGIDAQGCPGAGNYPHRVTLTRRAVLSARKIILFITGHEKASVLKAAGCKPATDAPVNTLFDAGSRLTVIWAP